MNFKKYRPAEKLSGVVRYYWTLDGNIPDENIYIHRTLANFCPELIFHYGGEFKELINDHKTASTFKTGIHGQTDRVRRFTAKNKYGIFGVMLEPYAPTLLFGVSSLEIKNELIELESLLSNEGKFLAEQMLMAADNTERTQIMNDFLSRRLREVRRPEVIYVTRHILKQNGQVDIRELAAQCFLSVRQFERKFKEYNGFSAKTFARLVRFKSLTGSFRKGDSSLTKLALDFGYYDQAHFIQDFKQFSGYNPLAYFSGQAKEVFYAP